MAKYQTSTTQVRKPEPSKATRKPISVSKIAQRYSELQRLREMVKAEADAR